MPQNLNKLLECLSKIKVNHELNEIYLEEINVLIKEFNKLNTSTFSFGDINLNESVKTNFTNTLYETLNATYTYLKNENSGRNDSGLTLKCSELISSSLDMIRLVSRDSLTICLFEKTNLLDLIQKIATLKLINDNQSFDEPNPALENLGLSALMSMSNIIYNSKFAQDFYVQNNVAEAITFFFKQLQLSEVLSQESNSETNKNMKLNSTIFKLRILFLLTVFNKDLRSKLREKLQVTTYLIEIIDLIMKERLQINEATNTDNETVTISDSSTDYCFLKLVDIEFINEILKILYNLTMDIAKPTLNFDSNSSGSSSNKVTQQNCNNEEEEAHLMHLVSVLRDLITCRIEHDTTHTNQNLHEKLNNLHSNIINLLTNMPSICFEELMTPCNTQSLNNFNSNNNNNKVLPRFEQINNYYIHARIAHNKKRQSRRSKRLRQKQDESATSKKLNKDYQDFDNNLSVIINSDEDLEFEGKNMEAVASILSFMNRHVTNYIHKPNSSNADQIYPVLLLLSLMCKSNNIIRHYSRLKVLPPLKKKDLINLPQSGNHIRNRLVRLMTDPNLQVKRLGAQLLFILCKESVNRLVKYTGYGNAAGLLAEAGLMLSSHGDRTAYSSDSDDSDTEDYKQLQEFINPITGRAEIDEAQIGQDNKKYLPAKKRDLFEGMSEEQKEYEAIQLANALDKLTRIQCGGIKPATIGPDGRVVEISHVLELQEKGLEKSIQKIKEKNDNDSDHD